MLGGGGTNTTTQGIVENIDKTPQIKYYNYAPNTIKVQRGSDRINFNYTPNSNLASTTSVEEYTFPTTSDIDPKYVKNIDARAGQTIAYEYVFGNTMNRTAAVNLKSIGNITDSGVSVSYLWRTSPLPQGESVSNSPAKFSCQEITNKNDTIYLYVIVSSESSTIPADFTTDIVWYYGVPYNMPLTNNIGGSNTSVKLVKGQAITEDALPDENELLTSIGKIDAGYYFDTWFTDSNYTKIADLSDIRAGKQLYPRFHNVPTGVTTYMTYDSTTQSYGVSKGCRSLVTSTNTSLIIPTYYNNGTNGKHLVTSIGSNAFAGCSNLTSITIPDSVTSIEGYAFLICTSLTSITIPSSVTSIGDRAFYCCESLTSIVVEAGNPVYDSRNNCNAIIETSTNTLIQGCSTTIIPNTVTSIESWAFYSCSSLTSITIPSSVTSIGSHAFNSCYALAEVYNLSSLTLTIGSSDNGDVAYYAKVIHTDASTPSKITTIDGVAYYKESDSSYIALLCTDKTKTSITLDSRTTSINQYAFYKCSSLTSITIPIGVTSIGDYAFQSCSKLTSLTFEDPTTWYRTIDSTNWANKTGGTQTDVSNASTAATYLESTYHNYYWYKL